MPSAYDCVVLSEDVYYPECGSVAVRLGWSRIRSHSGSHGFYAALYSKGGQIVVAYRGTDDFDDVAADISMANKIPVYQTQQAFAIYSDCERDCLNVKALTGHSLGGALAKIVSQKKNIMAIVFNAPYIGYLNGTVNICSPLIKNYNSNLDPVSGLTRLIGRMEEGQSEIITVSSPSIVAQAIDLGLTAVATRGIFPVPLMQGLHYHGIARMREAMEGKTQYTQEVGFPGYY